MTPGPSVPWKYTYIIYKKRILYKNALAGDLLQACLHGAQHLSPHRQLRCASCLGSHRSESGEGAGRVPLLWQSISA